ncbi:MAG: NTP transferase domain-containing protein [Thermoanaerobaculia bacterium]|nr:NTP transferase domain-containing protein [Thermoanaerobaculia bacterium]
MNIIIPMAGKGTRLRPHTLTVPKPLIPVAGKPIIQRLVEDLAHAYDGPIDEIVFIIGDFGPEIERELTAIAEGLGAKGKIYHQEKALGVGHAIYCAWESLNGPCMIAFADTLFKADFTFDTSADGMIWVQQVKDPSAFGVVKLDEQGYITEFVEKPSVFVSDLAIVGIYYFREGEKLRAALHHVITQEIREKNEFQLTTALELLKNNGLRFKTGEIDEWLDCGNKDAILFSNERMLEFHREQELVAKNAVIENSVIIPPCFIGDHAVIRNAVVGPYVSVGNNSTVENTVITNSIVQNKSQIKNALLENSMVGNSSRFVGSKDELNIGDYSNFSKR